MKSLPLMVLGGMLCCSAVLQAADEKIFSGPQVGEKLPAFKVRGVFEPDAGKELDFVTQADGKPIVLIFVHDANRQSIALTRVLSQYTVSRANDGLASGVVWLQDDATEAENTLKRIKHALAPKAPTGISVDGREGPGSYGLNRNVMLTILVGKESKVTANFALIQPSVQADLPKILESIVAVAGGKVPRLQDLEGMRDVMRNQVGKNADVPDMRPLMAPVIKLGASNEDVDAAAKIVEERAAKDDVVRKEIGRITSTIIASGRLDTYGTPHARDYMKKWAKAWGPGATEKKETPPKVGNE